MTISLTSSNMPSGMGGGDPIDEEAAKLKQFLSKRLRPLVGEDGIHVNAVTRDNGGGNGSFLFNIRMPTLSYTKLSWNRMCELGFHPAEMRKLHPEMDNEASVSFTFEHIIFLALKERGLLATRNHFSPQYYECGQIDHRQFEEFHAAVTDYQKHSASDVLLLRDCALHHQHIREMAL